MSTRGEATRARILAAASEEFARYGIAGSRVDRIADLARVNKAQLYTYFGSKEGLFDTVLASALEAIVDAVPLDGTDLPGYAVRLYDEYLARPELVRLATWWRLERRPAGDLSSEPLPRSAEKLAEIARAQAAGLIDPSLSPFDVFATLISLSMAWSPASPVFAAVASDPDIDHARRRDALRTLVRRAYALEA